MYNIISKTKYAYIFSGALMILSVISLFMWHLKFGIDFTGGTSMEIQFSSAVPNTAEISQNLANQNLGSLSFQPAENNSLFIRYSVEDDNTNQGVEATLAQKYPDAKILSLNYADSTISGELKAKALWALFIAVIGIMVYIAWAFRKVSYPVKSWKYGAGAVIALVHDVLITIGVFSVLGHFFAIEVGVPFIAALLTIIGFSVHDTIVVYDRTRENLLKSSSKEKFPDIVNRSLNETLTRSINTSMTVIITLLAIFIFGGASIKDFSLALLVGIFFGTYSSIFVASALLVSIYELQTKKA